MFKLKKITIIPEWEAALEKADLLNIEALTTRKFEWFEEPNLRFGGRSGVTRLCLNPEAPKAEQVMVFLKIQHNHCYRTIQNGMLKRQTFEREMDAFEGLKDTGLLPELLLFAKWNKDGDVGSVVITRALDGFVEIKDFISQIRRTLSEPDAQIRKVLASVADASRVMHEANWLHCSYKPKHVFIGAEKDGKFPIRLIDFERARHPFRTKYYVTEDLSRFLRKCGTFLTRDQKFQFLLDYFQTEAFSPKQLKLVDELEQQRSLDSICVESPGE